MDRRTLINAAITSIFIRNPGGAMTGLYVGLLVAGGFTFIPGRMLGNLVFG